MRSVSAAPDGTAQRADAPTNTNNKVDLWLCGDIEVAGRARRSLETDLVLLLCEVLLHIALCPLEDDLSLRLLGLKTGS